ncbi:MAG TPA: hypothetical protein VI386_34665 [Candidatus Sulfotelmatobacter sp.]
MTAAELRKPPAAIAFIVRLALGSMISRICFGLINDARQWPINILSLQRPSPTHFRAEIRGYDDAISIVSTRAVSEARAHDHSPKAVVLFCCFGLVASLGLMTFGVDLSAGWL